MRSKEQITKQLIKDLRWYLKNEKSCVPIGKAIWETRIDTYRWCLGLHGAMNLNRLDALCKLVESERGKK